MAKKLLKYIYESEFLDYSTSLILVSRKIRNKYSDFLTQYQKYIDNDVECIDFYGDISNWLDIRNIFNKYMQMFIRGDKSIEYIAKEFDIEANRIIDLGSNYVLHE